MSEKLEELISLLYQDKLTQYGKRLLVENIEKLQKENEELKSKNKTLEELLQGNLYELYKYYKELAGAYQGNSIPVQKIKDIIDRIDYDIKKTKEIISNDPKNNYQITRLKAMNTKSLDIKKRLQEVLESEE